MLEDIVQKKEERRKGPDLWIRMLTWMGVSGWLILFIAFAIADKAKPDRGTFIDMMYFQQLGIPVNLRLEWDPQLVTYIFYLMILGLCVSVTGLFINAQRHRRKYDHYRIQLFMLGAISLSAIIYHLI